MSLYEDLTEILTPYADKINQNTASLDDLRDDLDNLDVETDKTLSVDGKPADAKAVGDIVNPMRTATASDVGKALKAKTVTGGKVTEWEFGDVGGSTISCDVDANGNATFSLGEEDFSDIEALVGGTA